MTAQLDWLAGMKPPRHIREQHARKRGEREMARAQDAAESDFAQFREAARAFVVAYLKQHGPASSEDVTDAMVESGIAPREPRSFGAVYAYLAKHGRIRFVGYCTRVKGNGTAGGRVWEAA